MTTVCYTNIKWDIDACDVVDIAEIPTTLDIETDPSVLDDEDAEAIISDMLSEATGWCHNGFNYEIIG